MNLSMYKHLYKFKGEKHSVTMELISYDEKTGMCELINHQYKRLCYEAHIDDLEKVD